jgi:hypothetical protein
MDVHNDSAIIITGAISCLVIIPVSNSGEFVGNLTTVSLLGFKTACNVLAAPLSDYAHQILFLLLPL